LKKEKQKNWKQQEIHSLSDIIFSYLSIRVSKPIILGHGLFTYIAETK